MDGGRQGCSHAEYEQVEFEVLLVKISQHDNVTDVPWEGVPEGEGRATDGFWPHGGHACWRDSKAEEGFDVIMWWVGGILVIFQAAAFWSSCRLCRDLRGKPERSELHWFRWEVTKEWTSAGGGEGKMRWCMLHRWKCADQVILLMHIWMCCQGWHPDSWHKGRGRKEISITNEAQWVSLMSWVLVNS